MPRGEDVEITEAVDFLFPLVALFLVMLRALTFLLFFNEISIVVGETKRCESPAKTQAIPFVGG
jgi:hypothetical protein